MERGDRHGKREREAATSLVKGTRLTGKHSVGVAMATVVVDTMGDQRVD